MQIKENEEKIKLNKALPYLVGNVVEMLDAPEEVGGRLLTDLTFVTPLPCRGTGSHIYTASETLGRRRCGKLALQSSLVPLPAYLPTHLPTHPPTHRTSNLPIHTPHSEPTYQPPQDQEEEASGAAMDLDDHRKGKSCVIKTTTRQVCVFGSLCVEPLSRGWLKHGV